MPVTSADLWKLLKQSRLLSPQRLEQVRDVFAQSGSQPDLVPAKALAQWLTQRQMLTAYQANQLLNGRSGPFHYGDYQIQDRVRGGRLAKTFLAIHVPTRYGVQLKFASSRIAQDPRQWNAARQYIRSVAQVVQDQLQRVFVLDEQAGYRFLVLERLTGVTLAERLAQKNPLSVSEACQIVRLAALGLSALHEQHLVHGDLRPDNLWLESRGNVKLVRDSFHPPLVPAPWQPETTPDQLHQAAYMAPELVHPGTPLSGTTDIYSLGCTLYQLLQGKPPLRGRTVAETLQRHVEETIPPIRTQPIDPELAAIVHSMLAKEPSARPADGAAIAESLVPFIESSHRAIPESSPSATLLAFQQAIGHGTAVAAPAPPPVMSEPDDHPTLEEPPVQAPAAPAHMTQEIQPQLVDATEPAEAKTTPPLDVVSLPRHSKKRKRAQKKLASQRKQAIVLSVLAIAVLGAASWLAVTNPRLRARLWGFAMPDEAIATRNDSSPANDHLRGSKKRAPSTNSDSASATRYELRNDDGKLLWMPPTDGTPIELQYVAPGVQTLLIARPYDILTSANGPPTLKALGPAFDSYREQLETSAGVKLEDVEQLVICLHATQTVPATSVTCRLHQPKPLPELLTAWGAPAAKQHAGVTYYDAGNWSYLVPDQDSVARFVMADTSIMHEIIDGQDKSPLMRRDLARLLQNTDQAQHLSVLSSLDALDQEWCAVTGSPASWEPLRNALGWLLPEDAPVCQLNMQFGDQYFVELRARGLADADSRDVANALRKRLDDIPEQVERLLAETYPAAYWRRVALRLPEMMRFLLRYTRVGIEDGAAIANAILPGEAAHNLVFASAMLLTSRTQRAETTSPEVTSDTPTSLEQLVEQPMDLRFSQKSLEFAIADLAADIRETYPSLPFPFDIQIIGSDLQLNGITRNQQISAFRADDQPIAEILTAIVMRANPVTTVTDPAESDQKLVWVMGPDPVDPNRRILLITTRDAAQREGYKLPAPFQPK